MLDTIRGVRPRLRREPILIATRHLTLALSPSERIPPYSASSIPSSSAPSVSPTRPHLLGQRAHGRPSSGGRGRSADYYTPPRGASPVRRRGRLRPAHAELERPGKAGTTGRGPGDAFLLFRAGHAPIDMGGTWRGSEEGSEAPPPVVVSYAFWRGRLNWQPHVLWARRSPWTVCRTPSSASCRKASIIPGEHRSGVPCRWMNRGSVRAPPCAPCGS